MTFDVTAEGLPEPPSRVTYDLAKQHGATKFTLTHDQFPPDSKVLGISNGWPQILSSMKSYLERGAAMSMTEAMKKARGE